MLPTSGSQVPCRPPFPIRDASSNAVSASFLVVATRKLKSVGETSPLHQLTRILANKRRKLLRTPVNNNNVCSQRIFLDRGRCKLLLRWAYSAIHDDIPTGLGLYLLGTSHRKVDALLRGNR